MHILYTQVLLKFLIAVITPLSYPRETQGRERNAMLYVIGEETTEQVDNDEEGSSGRGWECRGTHVRMFIVLRRKEQSRSTKLKVVIVATMPTLMLMHGCET